MVEIPLLSQEGWREAPGWFQSEILQQSGFGTTPRVNSKNAMTLPSSLRRAIPSTRFQISSLLCRPLVITLLKFHE